MAVDGQSGPTPGIEQYQTIAESIPTAAYLLDSEQTIVYANRNAPQHPEISIDAYQGESILDLINEVVTDPQALDRFNNTLSAVYEEKSETDFPNTVVLDTDHPDGNVSIEYRFLPYERGGKTGALIVTKTVASQKDRKLARYERLFESLPVAVGINTLGEKGQFEYVNQTAVDMFDADSKAALKSYSPADLYANPDEREEFSAALKKNGTVEQYETLFTTLTGEKQWVSITAELITIDGEQHIAGIIEDISERKQKERELREERAFVDGILDSLTEVFYAFDTDGDLVEYNERLGAVTGYSSEELEMMSPCDFFATDEREMVGAAVDQVIENEEQVRNFEATLLTDDDETIPYEFSGAPFYNEDGTVAGFVGFGRDITDRKKREEELDRKQEFLEQTQEVANIGGWEVDLRTDTLRWTEEVYHIHGKPLDFEPTVDEAIDLYHPEDQPTIQEAVERATTEGESYDIEVRVVRPDGKIRWTRARGEPRYEDDEIIGVRGTFQDITDRKEREQQLEESNERLEQFAYVASHDLQEPLRTISNYTEVLAEDYASELDEEAKRFIDVIVTGSERMQSMINGLLDYSRVTTRGNEFEPVDTETVVAETVTDLDVMLDEHDGTVDIGNLPTVMADGDQLHQVFQNLLKNALEHGGEELTSISIRGSEESTHYRFEVEDDGPGIEANRHDKIFRIFKSGENYQTESQARGLGLAICDNIIRRHRGEIWVESEPGEGATFVFTIKKNKNTTDRSHTNDE